MNRRDKADLLLLFTMVILLAAAHAAVLFLYWKMAVSVLESLSEMFTVK